MKVNITTVKIIQKESFLQQCPEEPHRKEHEQQYHHKCRFCNFSCEDKKVVEFHELKNHTRKLEEKEQSKTIYTGAAEYFPDDDKYSGYDLVLIYNGHTHCQEDCITQKLTSNHFEKVNKLLIKEEAATRREQMQKVKSDKVFKD